MLKTIIVVYHLLALQSVITISMNIFSHFSNLLFKYINNIYPKVLIVSDVKVEFPKNRIYGDLSSNVAMVVAKKLKIAPIVVAKNLLTQIRNNDYIAEVSLAGAGFINLKVKNKFWHLFLKNLIIEGYNYPKMNIGNNKKISIEFVSPNPTGPLHLGHARGAILGDVISNLLTKLGFQVTKECYINDAGKQISNLVDSLLARLNQLSGKKSQLNEKSYLGKYVIDLAKSLKEQYDTRDYDSNDIRGKKILENLAIAEIMKVIKRDLRRLKVFHDKFVSEKSLIKNNKITKCINLLKTKGLLYKGKLDKPKGIADDYWESQTNILFKSSKFGDDIDRTIIKSDGTYTYFATDIAYHLDKIERGFDSIILLLGADHVGYKKRLESSVKALSNGKIKLVIKICQLVKIVQDGTQVKMSKRSGDFISLEKVLNIIGRDALRFSLLYKNADTLLHIDMKKLKDQTKDNAIFYIQYASARANSIIKKAMSFGINTSSIDIENTDLSYLTTEYDLSLIKILALYPKVLYSCISNLDVHKITSYLYETSCIFHQIWSKGTKEENIRFIIKENLALTKSRILLVSAINYVLTSGLKILGIEALKKI